MKCIFFLLLVLVASTSAKFSSIGYKGCKAEGTVTDVQAEGCTQAEREGKKVCIFTPGSHPIIQIHFKPAKPSNTLKTSIKAKVGKASLVDFPQTNDDACSYGVKCPLQVGSPQVFQQSIAISEGHPKNEVIQVNWSLSRDDGEKEACIVFLAVIE